jgi:hypothetical protein
MDNHSKSNGYDMSEIEYNGESDRVWMERTMGKTVTLQIPEEIAESAQKIAQDTKRRLEEVLVEWLEQASSDVAIETLSDKQILALCESQLSSIQQDELSDLLAQQRESTLDESGKARLDMLMTVYRRGMIRKSQALKIAVERGLRPPVSEA